MSRLVLIVACSGALVGCPSSASSGPDGGEPALPDAGPREADHGPLADAGRDGSSGDLGPRCTPNATLGQGCTLNADCDDGCFCSGVERCQDGRCVAGSPPCVDSVACTDESCDEALDACAITPQDARCGRDACRPRRCDAMRGCVDAAAPDCADDDACSIDRCDPRAGCLPADPCLSLCEPLPLGCEAAPLESCDDFEDNDLDGLADALDPDCAPTNGTCAVARELGASGLYKVSALGLGDDYVTSCGVRGRADSVFTFTLREARDLRVEQLFETDGTIELRGPGDATTCAEAASALACGRGRPGRSATFSASSLGPGTYWLVVEGGVRESSRFAFELTAPRAGP